LVKRAIDLMYAIIIAYYPDMNYIWIIYSHVKTKCLKKVADVSVHNRITPS